MSTDTAPKTSDIIKSTKLALRDTDPILIAKAHLEIAACQMHYLEAIDWKLWEIYSMLKKHDGEKSVDDAIAKANGDASKTNGAAASKKAGKETTKDAAKE